MDEMEIDRQALVQAFLGEAEELLATMEQTLMALEAQPESDELLGALFRAAHTLKGSASLVDFDGVRDLAHELEGLMERLRSRTLRASEELVTLLLQSVDLLRRSVAEAASGRTGPTPEVEALRRRIAAAAEGRAPDEPASAAGSPVAAAPAAPATRTLRVDVSKLDRMLDLSGEIGIARLRLADMLERRTSLAVDQILEAHRESDRLYRDLQDLIVRARMVPIGPVFQSYLRTVRDVAAAQGKRARLSIEGGEVEVDTSVVEHMRDPITHMVRNALDHGIEQPEVRRRRGKDPVGRLSLRARHEGSSIAIEVADDGAGIDCDRVAERAARIGLVADASSLAREEVLRLIFEPGLSTSDRVTDLSGRGVGMDVVRRNAEALRGSVSVWSEPQKGTAVTLRLPLTLALIQGFRVAVGEETYIVPLEAVVECVELPAGERAAGAAAGIFDLRGHPLPFLRLRRHFRTALPAPGRENLVVVQHGGSAAGLAVDALLGECQTVVKPLGPMMQSLSGISGSSIMGDGRVALILDVGSLLREALKNVAPQA